MGQRFHYVNKKGTAFDILLDEASVPPDANYFGFLFRVTEAASEKNYTYRALLKKEEFATKAGAAAFVAGDPLSFLKAEFLDRYTNGSHPLLWPSIKDGWVVF